MGAAAYGDMNRSTNRFYSRLRNIFSLQPNGDVHLSRSLANWPRHMLRKPYTPELLAFLGPPIALEDMWNPDAVLWAFVSRIRCKSEPGHRMIHRRAAGECYDQR